MEHNCDSRSAGTFCPTLKPIDGYATQPAMLRRLRINGELRSGHAVVPSPALTPSSCQLRSPLLCQLRSLPDRLILTIAPMVSQIGKQVGQWQRRNGAAESTARVVRIKAVAV